MGWNSYNAFGCANNEADLIAAANSIISLGLKDLGYIYVNGEISRILFCQYETLIKLPFFSGRLLEPQERP
jgi:hypothetical protein